MDHEPERVPIAIGGEPSPLVAMVRPDVRALLMQCQRLWRPYIEPGSLLAILADLIFLLIFSPEHRGRADRGPSS